MSGQCGTCRRWAGRGGVRRGFRGGFFKFKQANMNRSKTTVVLALVAVTGVLMVSGQSCSKKSSPPAAMTLYDSLGGTTMVTDPANSGQMVEKGYLGIRTIVDSAVFIIAADTQINGYFKVLLTEVTGGNLSGYQRLSTDFSNFV